MIFCNIIQLFKNTLTYRCCLFNDTWNTCTQWVSPAGRPVADPLEIDVRSACPLLIISCKLTELQLFTTPLSLDNLFGQLSLHHLFDHSVLIIHLGLNPKQIKEIHKWAKSGSSTVFYPFVTSIGCLKLLVHVALSYHRLKLLASETSLVELLRVLVFKQLEYRHLPFRDRDPKAGTLLLYYCFTTALLLLYYHRDGVRGRGGRGGVGATIQHLGHEKVDDGMHGWPSTSTPSSRMLMYADVCWRMLTYPDICYVYHLLSWSWTSTPSSRMLTYADVCWRMLDGSPVSLVFTARGGGGGLLKSVVTSSTLSQ